MYLHLSAATLHSFNTVGPFVAQLISPNFGTGYFETSG